MFDSNLPDDAIVRLSAIIGNPKADPPVQGVYPVSKSTWWQGIRDGKFPPGVSISARATAWRVGDIRALLRQAGAR